MRNGFLLVAAMVAFGWPDLAEAAAAQRSSKGVRHAFLAVGARTFIVDGAGKVAWRYPRSTRDGWILSNGNALLVLPPGKNYTGGVVEVTLNGRTVFAYRGTQELVASAQRLENGHYLIAECGQQPQLRIVDYRNRLIGSVFIRSNVRKADLQISYVRQLANGHFLVTQPGDKTVREYTPRGEVAWEMPLLTAPVSAVRLTNGRTLISLENRHVLEVNKDRRVTWSLTKTDFGGKPYLEKLSAIQLLPNGHLVFCTFNTQKRLPQLMEFNRDKELVWTYLHPARHHIRTFQILETNGRAIDRAAQR